jgi:hypothetical protein
LEPRSGSAERRDGAGEGAHVRLCHSRMLFVRAYPRETQEMVFDAHDRAFALFKGTCRRGIYDNMKTAVETVFGSQRFACPSLLGPANFAISRATTRICGGYSKQISSAANANTGQQNLNRLLGVRLARLIIH